MPFQYYCPRCKVHFEDDAPDLDRCPQCNSVRVVPPEPVRCEWSPNVSIPGDRDSTKGKGTVIGKLALEIASAVEAKGRAYGPVSDMASVMRVLYLGQVESARYDEFYLVMRIVDNLCRISNGHHRDSWCDIAGLALRGAQMFEKDKS